MDDPPPTPTPGVYDIPAAKYHADPVPGGSLSSSGARKLLPPSCPAKFHYDATHPRAPKKVFDLGHAAHKLVLGVGPQLVRISAEEWRTNAVKKEVADARASGAVPLRPSEYETVHAMAAELRRHPLAAALFGDGLPEQTLIWQDPATGVMCRAMLDWLPNRRPGRRLIIADYKSSESVAPAALRRSLATYRYYEQAAWYLAGVTALGLDEAPAFVFVAQEKDPPYLVTPFQLHPDDLQLGADKNQRAREIYRDCTAANLWPGYADDTIIQITLPPWERRQYEEASLDN